MYLIHVCRVQSYHGNCCNQCEAICYYFLTHILIQVKSWSTQSNKPWWANNCLEECVQAAKLIVRSLLARFIDWNSRFCSLCIGCLRQQVSWTVFRYTMHCHNVLGCCMCCFSLQNNCLQATPKNMLQPIDASLVKLVNCHEAPQSMWWFAGKRQWNCLLAFLMPTSAGIEKQLPTAYITNDMQADSMLLCVLLPHESTACTCCTDWLHWQLEWHRAVTHLVVL